MIDVPAALRCKLDDDKTTLTWKDAVLYALGVGMGRRDKEEERRYLYEMDEAFVPLPTLAFAPAFPLTIASLQADGLESVDPAAVVHGESEMLFHRGGVLPLNEELTSKGAITAVEDKGSGALITTTVDTFDTFGRKVFSNIFRNFARGAGGFSKEKRGKSARPPPPSLPSPSHVLLSEVVHTYDDQAYLYRLSGDYNPLHADFNIANAVGYERPILHGLCTLGICAASLVTHMMGGDPAPLRSIKARFSKPVIPGDSLRVVFYRDSGDSAEMVRFQCWAAKGRVEESRGDSSAFSRLVVTDGVATIDRAGKAKL